MPKITVIEHNGIEHVLQAEVGQSLMQALVDNQVPGILADCGGCCSCATCHAYVDAAWFDRIPPAAADELAMHDGAVDLKSNSRLTCQIKIDADMDGLTVSLPVSQI